MNKMPKPRCLKSWPAVLTVLLASLLILTACNPQVAAGEFVLPTPTQTLDGPSAPVTATSTPFFVARLTQIPVSAPVQEFNCTYSAYYWQLNPDRWLTDNLVIGRFTYTKEDALLVLGNQRTDSTNMILKDFFAAALNILKGANPTEVEQAMVQASNWLNAHPPGFEVSATDSQLGLELATRLQAFNSGAAGPGMCKDEPPTPTPIPTNTPTITPTPTATPVPPTDTPVWIEPTRYQPVTQPTAFIPQPTVVVPTAVVVPPTAQPTNPPPPPTQEPTREPPTSAPPPTVEPTSAPPEPATEPPPAVITTEQPPAPPPEPAP